jgi:transcription antitermination factor NusG
MEISKNANQNYADLHKGSGISTSDEKWYIGECKPTKERTIRKALEKKYEVYVASLKETKVYASRNRREVEKIVIPGIVFIRTTEAHLWDILLEYPSIYRFMINKAASDKEKGKRIFAYVRDEEMQQLRYVLDNAPNPVMITTQQLSLGPKIEITRGPLIGLQGELAKIENASYIVLKMEMGERNYVLTEISVQDIRPVET